MILLFHVEQFQNNVMIFSRNIWYGRKSKVTAVSGEDVTPEEEDVNLSDQEEEYVYVCRRDSGDTGRLPDCYRTETVEFLTGLG